MLVPYDQDAPPPPPLDMPTPAPDARGVVDLRPVVEAARAAAGYGAHELEGDWPTVAWVRHRIEDTICGLLAAWHGVPTRGPSSWRVDETVRLAATVRVTVDVGLTRTPRGFWLKSAIVGLPDRTSYDGGCVQDWWAYADRETALRHAAHDALGSFRVGREARYVRIVAALEAACGDLLGEAA